MWRSGSNAPPWVRDAHKLRRQTDLVEMERNVATETTWDVFWPGTSERIVGVTSWQREAFLQGADAYGFVALTDQSLIFFEPRTGRGPKEDPNAAQRAVHRSIYHGGEADAYADLARLASGNKAGDVMRIALDEIVEISALDQLGVLQIRTRNETLAVGGFHERVVAGHIADRLGAALFTGSTPKVRAKPTMTSALARQVATMPMVVAFFAALLVAGKYLLMWDTPNTYNSRGEGVFRAILDPFSPGVVIIAALCAVAAVTALSVSRVRDERVWRAVAA